MERAKLNLMDWKEANSAELQNTPNHLLQYKKWEKPKVGWTKLNVDAALDSSDCIMGFGWIMRDDIGIFVAAKGTPKEGKFQPKEAEAMAICEALSWLKSKNIDKVHIENDCLLVVQGLVSFSNISYFDLILSNIRDMCSQFNDVTISFVKR